LLLALDELCRLDRSEVTATIARRAARRRETVGFPTPSTDVGDLIERLGCKLFARERPLIQYVAWANESRLLELMGRREFVCIDDVCSHTCLSEAGGDSLLGVVCALGLATRSPDARYSLTAAARDYLLPDSPYFVGGELHPPSRGLPRAYRNDPGSLLARALFKLLCLRPSFRYGTRARLANQHVRNLPACAAAVRTGEFDQVRCMVDLAGGSGAFAIPFSLQYPRAQIVLTELPRAVKNVRWFLGKHGMDSKIRVLGADAFRTPWRLPDCDGIFIGNFLHGFADEGASMICRQAFLSLPARGKIWLHEMLWNPNKDGPLITALWHAVMRVGGGRQRTADELMTILRGAGFVRPYVVPTAAAFALVAAEKP